MIIYGFIWWIFPWFALFIFLILSAYHFAETDLLPLELPKNNVTILLQFIYGIIIISNLLLPHQSEVLEILSALPQSNLFLPTISVFINQTKNLPFYLILFWIGILIIQLSTLKLLHAQQKGLLIAQAILLPLVLNQLPLYLGFALYFGLWHSVISLQTIYFHLYEEEKSVKRFISSAIPFTVLACAGIGLLIFFGNYTGSLNQTSMALFIGIAVLTLPHLSVMSELFQASKKD
jgi:Brp/Blh family beta-carotene 15,15'-monooxygenase